VPPIRCGDGIVDDHEECDDGNLINGDGCTSACLVCDDSLGDARVPSETGACFVRFNARLPWHRAEERCETLGGHLATLNKRSEIRVLENELLNTATHHWIGHHLDLSTKLMEWVTGEVPETERWHAEGGAMPGLGRDCSALSGNPTPQTAERNGSAGQRLALEDCTNLRPFVCEKPSWLERSGSHSTYKPLPARQSWSASRKACENQGATLALINDDAERNFLSNNFQGPLWLGARKETQSPGITWLDGNPVAPSALAPTDVSDLGEQAACLATDRGGLWHPRACETRLRAVCERTPAKTNTSAEAIKSPGTSLPALQPSEPAKP